MVGDDGGRHEMSETKRPNEPEVEPELSREKLAEHRAEIKLGMAFCCGLGLLVLLGTWMFWSNARSQGKSGWAALCPLLAFGPQVVTWCVVAHQRLTAWDELHPGLRGVKWRH